MPIEDKDKINILLKEYDTLREETLSRMNNRFVMLGMTAAFLGFVLFSDNVRLDSHMLGLTLRTIVLVCGIMVVLAIWLFFGYLVGTLARRVAAIERHVNQIAGERLLRWESEFGWGRWGKFSGAQKDDTIIIK